MRSDYPYNDDLLNTEEDQARARSEYEPIAFALIFPTLISKVADADQIANRSKRRLREKGLLSVALVTAALLAASAAPLYREFRPWSEGIVILSAFVGIAGGLLGVLNRGQEWLKHRLITESLRQFHFRLIIQLAPDILDAAMSNDTRHFENKRASALAAFEQDVVRRKVSVLHVMIDEPEAPIGMRINPRPDPEVFTRQHGDVLLRAYRHLRILRQRQYADHKLTTERTLFSAFPRTQAFNLSAIGLLCVALLLAIHIGSALIVTLVGEEISAWLHLAAVWIAIIALAFRAIEEGLKPRAETERYRHYQAATRRILERFDVADVAGKLQAAEDLEQAAFDEMVIFLRSSAEARFVM